MRIYKLFIYFEQKEKNRFTHFYTKSELFYNVNELKRFIENLDYSEVLNLNISTINTIDE